MRRPVGLWPWTLILAAILAVGACEAPRTGGYPVSPTYYYVSRTTSYLRECPSYECGIVAQVFSGDRVTVLDRNDFGWARAQSDRSGAIGWIPADLLTMSPVPASYYVSLSNAYLRECADYNCRALELLYRGDRVEKLDQDNRGWWRVMSFKTKTQGWLPVSALSPRPGPPYYYVNVGSLALRAGPSTGTRTMATLHLNNQVEVLDQNPGGWWQVRDVRTGVIGWVSARYLETFPVSAPKPAPAKKRAPAPTKKEAPEPEEAPKPAPKVM